MTDEHNASYSTEQGWIATTLRILRQAEKADARRKAERERAGHARYEQAGDRHRTSTDAAE